MFGPHRFGEAFVFIGAFSRESVDLLALAGAPLLRRSIGRVTISRATSMPRTVFKSAGAVPLGNAVDDDQVTTGDHDGRAVVLRAPPPRP